ncbi:sugar phosphate isomerase/epimerase family protein [Pseudomonas sp. 5P_3.1_Bac2]|uniref:sugar phosphate isomerase/epimerase family protein n=1 Tax=Pseudomonas sp. 5P_3.1_Bac2 TaxID=2971617 RepID=UPI0021C5FB76|nr:TIM barrel protein [Pseudomonas sp. 5P_3.1_Bac2]MCU1719067.1 TIM barrel protein [Pseudomonas sp. 5P_3.1_Bac2]
MRLELFRTLWGYRATWQQAVDELLAAGFDGLEARVPETSAQRSANARLLREQGVNYIATVFTSTPVLPRQTDTPQMHLDDLVRKLDWAAQLAPQKINILAGNDRWGLSEQVDFFARAVEIAKASGQTCCFEIHRGRSLYSPWVTLDVLRQVAELRLTSDISHWVVTCERLLNDPADDLSAFIERVDHIQARVGYDQGPQVPHPGAPEYAEALQFHQQHWEKIWASQERRGFAVTSMTPEFGPDGYLHHLPYTDVPVADLWGLNKWMATCERQHFHRFSSR